MKVPVKGSSTQRETYERKDSVNLVRIGHYGSRRGVIEKIDGNGSSSSLELITGPRAKQGPSKFRMYATQGFSDVPDVHKDFPKREQNLIQVDGQKMTPHASLYMLAKPSESSFRTTKEYRVVQTPFTVRRW